MKKMWYIYTMKYYRAMKRKDTGPLVEMWMALGSVIQSGVSQKEKNKYHMLLLLLSHFSHVQLCVTP